MTTTPAPHTDDCDEDSTCRCGPTVQCPAVLVDLDREAWRCYLDPGHHAANEGADHESDEGWEWDDHTNTVTYAVAVADTTKD